MSYAFTTDWSASWLGYWPTLFAACVGKPGLRFVEVGSYEGRSATWLVDNVLTGDGSSILCIDAWADYDQCAGVPMAEVEARFDSNVRACSKPHAIQKFKERSSFALEQAGYFMPGYVDLVYIDGSHTALDVLIDGALGWRMVKPGGLMIFDDYRWEPAEGVPGGAPRVAIDALLTVLGSGATSVCAGTQMVVTKVAR